MHEDVKWLLGLIIMFALFWYASGSFNKPTSQKPFIQPLPISGDARYGSEGRIGGNSAGKMPGRTPMAGQIKSGGSEISAADEVAQTLLDAQIQAEKIQEEINRLEEEGKSSPLSGKISIVKINRGGTSSAGEYITLRAANTNTEKLPMTGLRLESSVSGRGVDIPKGVQLIFQNQVNVEQPIYLAAGETAHIITGRSPLGTSFRLNKCTGFFSQFQSFTPSIPNRCPASSVEPLTPPVNQYNDQCLEYINTLRKCQVIVKPPVNISPECQKYVTTEINYTKCVENHKNDKDFYDPEWRVYLNRDDTLWKSRREVIYLLDSDRRVIHAITY